MCVIPGLGMSQAPWNRGIDFATPRKLGSDLGQLMSENRVKLCSETQNEAERIGTKGRRFVEEKRRNEKN